MIIRDAIRSLKKDFSKAFFYWLIFTLTTMFIYLFCSIATSDPNSDPLHSTNTITYVMVLVVVLCSVDILFANDFYVKLKGKDLAVRLICGGKFSQIATFLLSQTILLLVLAIPLGILLANCMLPLINVILTTVNSDFVVVNQQAALLDATVIILYVVFWIIMLNMSFAYRNAVGLLMNPSSMTDTGSGSTLGLPGGSKVFKKILWTIVFFLPIGIFYWNRNLAIIASIIGMFGLNGCLSYVVTPWIDKNAVSKYSSDSIKMISIGFVRRDLKVLKNNIFLFETSAIILASMLVNSMNNAVESMIIFISFMFMTFLQGLALMFKFGTEVSQRKRLFQTLSHIGCVRNDQKKIIRREVMHVYGFIGFVTILYVLNILLAYVIAKDLTTASAIFLLLGALLPLIVCCLINLVLYRKAVFVKEVRAEAE